MRRQAIVLLAVTWLIVDMLALSGGRAWASSSAALKSVKMSENAAGAELFLHIEGTCSYKTAQPSPDTLFIDLTGVTAEGVARSRNWANSSFSGYRLVVYKDASGQPVVRIQLNVTKAGPYVVQKEGSDLRLRFGEGAVANAVTAPAATTASTPVAPERPADHAAPSMPPTGPVLVSKVSFDKRESGETAVLVSTSRHPEYQVMVLKNPARLVVDIKNAETASSQRYQANTPVLNDVRVGQFRFKDPAIVRVVADLSGDPAFGVHDTPEGVSIELKPHGLATAALPAVQTPTKPPAPAPTKSSAVITAAVPAAAPAPITAPAPTKSSAVITAAVPAAAPAPITAPAAKTGPSEAKPVITARVTPPAVPPFPVAAISPVEEVKSAASPPPEAARRDTPEHTAEPAPATNSQDAAKPNLQSTLPNPVQVDAAPLPPPSSDTPEALRAVKAAQILEPANNGPMRASQGMAAGASPAPAQEAKPEYTGEPISMNLKDVDLKDFFRLIHEISGLNIIIDPNVTGSVTLVLDSVPWDQALDIVLKDNGLGKVLEGNVLRIARLQTLTSEQETQTKLTSARMDAAPLVTLFRPMNYAKAQEVATLLKTWTGGGALSRRGTVLVDVRDNTLVISDVQSQMPIIESVLARLDRKAKQISIEARVVLATADFTRNLAASLLGGYVNRSTVATGVTGTNSSISIPTPTASQPFPITTATNATVSGFGAASVVNVGANYFINAAISAAEERDQAKTISRPSIVTQNNTQGMVQQGVQVPEQTTINNTISVQYVNATLQLTVTPQVTEDGNIFMIIHVLNNSVGATVTNIGPEINTQEATTQVLVPDGGTVVFGGITVTSRSKSATYIPVLGQIPLLGNLFKTSNVSDQDQELLFFVTPRVLPG